MTLLEVCVESADAALRVVQAGAHRIELCADLSQDGLTPTARVIRSTLELVNVPVHVMVRCRPGSFRYNDVELRRMETEVEMARELGAHGLAFGALDADGKVDVQAVSRILNRAGGLPVTFHRAFDRISDPLRSLDTLIELRVQRVLTSGGAATAWEGRELLRELVRHADGRIVVMAGGGGRHENVERLVAGTGVTEIHSSVPLTL